MASGEYIARIDSDDVWELNKLETQVQYMDNHPECGACFTKVNIIDAYSNIANDVYGEYFQLFNNAENRSQKEWLRFFFYQGNCLCHPSVVIRRSALERIGEYYHLAYVPAEDYELWVRLLQAGYKAENLSDILVYARTDNGMIKRRGGLSYARAALNLQKTFFKSGFLNRREYLRNCVIRVTASLIPASVRGILYQKKLRGTLSEDA